MTRGRKQKPVNWRQISSGFLFHNTNNEMGKKKKNFLQNQKLMLE